MAELEKELVQEVMQEEHMGKELVKEVLETDRAGQAYASGPR